MDKLFGGCYKDRRVLVTGHTGFKGSWLCLWLQQIGAKVAGYALGPETDPNHFDLLGLDIESTIGDIRDQGKLDRVFSEFQPEIVFHMAAQPLVRLSYREPVETLETNIIGTAKVFEACRKASSVRAIVNVTSDKCYENREWIWGYRENDPMGGYDPYSASKGCAELIANSYRNSFFNVQDFGIGHHVLLGSCRAGNVIGGGDWAADRLIPDIMKAAAAGVDVEIRNPNATRPWQHVLEPLSGYLLVGRQLFEGNVSAAEGWNFGPGDEGTLTVGQVAELIRENWDRASFRIAKNPPDLHEATLLKLDCSKAHAKLKWRPVWSSVATVSCTVDWYREYYATMAPASSTQLNNYVAAATEMGLHWTGVVE